MLNISNPFEKKPKRKIHKIQDISNPMIHMNPDFIFSQAKNDRIVQAWEYVYLMNDKEMSSYRVKDKQIKHVEITHECLLSEIIGYVEFACGKKKAKQVKPLVPFNRLEAFAKRLNLVSIVIFYDKLGNKYEFAMRLIFKKGK